MKLLFKQRLFSWFDSYDIYDENGDTLYVVKGQLAWGHKLAIYDKNDEEVGMVKQEMLTLLPKFEIYEKNEFVGYISKEITMLKPKYNIDFNGWTVNGDIMAWDYKITDQNGLLVADINKEIFNLTDTYSIDVTRPEDALHALMFVLAIDAEKCTVK